MTISEIAPLQSPLAAVQRLLERFDNQGVIVGGVAASVLGNPRLTADVDVIILLSVSRLPHNFWRLPPNWVLFRASPMQSSLRA